MTLFARLPDGGRLAYDVRGPRDAPPILLLRPLGGSRLSWGELGDALAERLRVVAFDARGTGESSDVPWATSTRTMARDALGLLDALALPRASVYGASLGGMVATWLAVDAASRVQRLVLASTLPRTRLSLAGTARALSLGRCLVEPPARAEACLASRVLTREFRRTHGAELERIRARATTHPSSRRALLILLGAAARHDASPYLHRIEADTLLIVGDRDRIAGGAAQRRLLRRIPRARLEIARGAGHDVSTEAPAWTAARVVGHVLGEPRRPGALSGPPA